MPFAVLHQTCHKASLTWAVHQLSADGKWGPEHASGLAAASLGPVGRTPAAPSHGDRPVRQRHNDAPTRAPGMAAPLRAVCNPGAEGRGSPGGRPGTWVD